MHDDRTERLMFLALIVVITVIGLIVVGLVLWRSGGGDSFSDSFTECIFVHPSHGTRFPGGDYSALNGVFVIGRTARFGRAKTS